MSNALMEKAFSWLERLNNIVHGKLNVKNETDIILDPDNIATSSYLNNEQTEFSTIADWLDELDPLEKELYKPVKLYADKMRINNISFNGRGIDKAIQFKSAIDQSKLVNSLYSGTKSPEKKRIFKPKEDKS